MKNSLNICCSNNGSDFFYRTAAEALSPHRETSIHEMCSPAEPRSTNRRGGTSELFWRNSKEGLEKSTQIQTWRGLGPKILDLNDIPKSIVIKTSTINYTHIVRRDWFWLAPVLDSFCSFNEKLYWKNKYINPQYEPIIEHQKPMYLPASRTF